MQFTNIIVLSTLFSSLATAVDVKGIFDEEALRKKYAPLYQTKIVQHTDGSLSFDKARLFRKDGINVLYMKGDQFEMAYQHGVLLKDQIADGAAIQSSKLIPNTVKNAVGDGLVAGAVAF